MPGRKIYVHPKGKRKVHVPAESGGGAETKSSKGRKGSTTAKMVEEVVQDQGEWSIWEVDGEEEKDVVSLGCPPKYHYHELTCLS